MSSTDIATSWRRTSVDDVLDILSHPGDRDLSEIVELAASICGGEAAGISIRRGDYYHVPITYGIDPFVCSAEETFCQVTMSTDGLYVVEDAHADSRFADIGFVNGDLARARFYASAPIHDPTGTMVGRLCVIANEPKRLTDPQVRALETLGRNVSKLIELRLLLSAGSSSARPARSPDPDPDVAALLERLTAERNHDLKVPLTAIVASLEMLSDRLGEDPDQVVGLLLDRSSSSAARMTRMLYQSLNAAAQAGEAHPLGRTNLAAVARQVADDCASLLEPVDAVVVVDDLPSVRADADEMYSVFQNLITNSLKFGRPGVPVRILVTARRLQDGWRIAVHDNGVGIPPDRRADVFSIFSRANTDVQGHGIGLASVARIVTAHGGQVGASESPGGGTEIWFHLPAA